MRGRKPTPTHLRLVMGNRGKRPLNRCEPQLQSALPIAPEHLSVAAKAKWESLAPQLHESGLLTRVDADMLAMYCSSWAEMVALEGQVQRYGMMLKGPRTTTTHVSRDGTEVTEVREGQPYPNPYFYMRNKVALLAHKLGVEFGMSPSSRSRVSVRSDAPKDDPAHKYIG